MGSRDARHRCLIEGSGPLAGLKVGRSLIRWSRVKTSKAKVNNRIRGGENAEIKGLFIYAPKITRQNIVF